MPTADAISSSPPAASRGRKIGVLVVAYNAATTIASVLERISAPVWANVTEVAVFDDASGDDTCGVAAAWAAAVGQGKLSVQRNPINLGYGGNQKAGYGYFLHKNFDAVVLLHGDGQYAPEMLAALYGPLAAGRADAVFGSRMTNQFDARKGGMPWHKYWGNRILTCCENRALGLRLSEFHSGYRAYSLAALRQIRMGNMTNDFHFDTQIIIKWHHQKFTILEVPIPTFYGDEICRVNGMKYAKDVFRTLRRYRRTCRGQQSYSEYAEYFPR